MSQSRTHVFFILLYTIVTSVCRLIQWLVSGFCKVPDVLEALEVQLYRLVDIDGLHQSQGVLFEVGVFNTGIIGGQIIHHLHHHVALESTLIIFKVGDVLPGATINNHLKDCLLGILLNCVHPSYFDVIP